MRKMIVNPDPYLFASLGECELKQLSIRILAGEVFASGGLPTELRVDERALALAKAWQVQGHLTQLLASSDTLGDAPTESRAQAVWEERLFLKGFALSRLEKSAEAEVCFQRLPRRFASRIENERALLHVNRGRFVEAAGLFVNALGRDLPFDPYSACTLLGGLSLAWMAQGEFARADEALAQRRQILRRTPSPSLAFGTRLYEILLDLERQQFASANTQIAKALDAAETAPINSFFLRHLRLRLHVAQRRLDEAERDLDHLKALVAQEGLREGVLDFRLEEVELDLQRRDFARATEAIAILHEAARRRKDDFLLFRVLILEAQLQAGLGEGPQALTTIRRAVERGEAGLYKTGLTSALFHAAGLTVAAGLHLEGRLFLRRGLALATELRLQVRRACFSYMLEVLENRYADASSLIALAKRREIGPEIEYLLDSYDFLKTVRLSVFDGARTDEVAEPNLRRQLFSEAGLFWFQRESCLILNPGRGRTHLLELAPASPLTAAFRLFWMDAQKRGPGLKLVDIHRVRSTQPYREELHASAAKMLLSRLRAQLKKLSKEASMQIRLDYDRERMFYALSSDVPLFTIASAAAKSEIRNDRRAEILARVAQEPFVSTRTLCEEFKITRQALHPELKRLVDEGRLRLVKRGPRSGYVLR